ncbi:MAG: phosphoribosylglycinamide formyltransferase [Acidimicrobiales bacterium]
MLPRLGVLVSGTGSILASLIADRLPIVVVATDRPCAAEQIANDAGIATERVERQDFGQSFDRVAYTGELIEVLWSHRVDAVAMAGFGTVLSGEFVAAFSGRVLNTHPSLLPAFRGWHAVEAALAAGVEETGCTVHLVTEAVDEGPVLAQRRVPVLRTDDEQTLHERIKSVERVLYPETIRAYLDSVGSATRTQRVAR